MAFKVKHIFLYISYLRIGGAEHAGGDNKGGVWNGNTGNFLFFPFYFSQKRLPLGKVY